MILRNIPWERVKRLIYNFRKTFYTVPKPEVECAVVDADFDELRRELGKENFMKEWGLSYNYKGEKLNMRRPEHVDDEFEWYQLHVRGFETPDGKVELQAHMELETVSYPGEHLKETNFSWTKGLRRLVEILDEREIEYEIRNAKHIEGGFDVEKARENGQKVSVR